MKKLFMIGVATTLLVGCETSPPLETGINPKVYEYQKEQTEKEIDRMPDWVVETPTKDGSIFSSGMGVAPDFQTSVDEAVINAKRVLADRLNGKLNSMTKTYRKRIGTGMNMRVLSEVETVSKNVIVDTDVSGYHVVETDIKPLGTYYRTFVLLEFPMNDYNQIQLQKLARQQDRVSSKLADQAFGELDAEVRSSRKVETESLDALVTQHDEQ